MCSVTFKLACRYWLYYTSLLLVSCLVPLCKAFAHLHEDQSASLSGSWKTSAFLMQASLAVPSLGNSLTWLSSAFW